MRSPLHPTGSLTAATRVFAVLGDPVSHSLSPIFQNAALRAAGLDAIYVALRCSRAAAPALVDALARSGGGGNVTLPHKQVILRAIEAPTDAVDRTGACNTFWLESGRVCGDNTDVSAFLAATHALNGSTAGARALLLGAGGAARAAACALLDDGIARIDVLNRTRDRAEDLRARLDKGDNRVRVAESIEVAAGEQFDLVVNATSLGLRDSDPHPVDLSRLAHVGAAIDLVYRPGGTAWSEQAAALGIPAADGLEMLLHQGAAAFELWWGRPAPMDVMRQSLTAVAPPISVDMA
jgi:shikimate dehydrogenase